MSLRASSLLLLLGVAASTWSPVAWFGEGAPVGRIDAWSIHGLSPDRCDGLGDPPQFALCVGVSVLALAGAAGSRRAARGAHLAGLLLVAMVLGRIATRLALDPHLDAGITGLPLLILGAAWREIPPSTR